jgi:AcrR family transcriptional regulator
MKKGTKKDRFLEEVLLLIYEKGFKATTMRDIAYRLNFDVANIYNYIDSKHSLLETYLFDISNEFNKSIDLIISSTYSPREKLRQIISSYIRITANRPYEQALLVNEWRNLKEPKLQEFIDARKLYELKLKTVISEGIKKGEIRKMDADIATFLILAPLRGMYTKYIEEKNEINHIEVEKQITDFIFGGILKN